MTSTFVTPTLMLNFGDHCFVFVVLGLFDLHVCKGFVTRLPIKRHNVLQDRIESMEIWCSLKLSVDLSFYLEITVPFYSEHCVLHLHRREERRGLELQNLAHGEEG